MWLLRRVGLPMQFGLQLRLVCGAVLLTIADMGDRDALSLVLSLSAPFFNHSLVVNWNLENMCNSRQTHVTKHTSTIVEVRRQVVVAR
jgi:hypothetical protein